MTSSISILFKANRNWTCKVLTYWISHLKSMQCREEMAKLALINNQWQIWLHKRTTGDNYKCINNSKASNNSRDAMTWLIWSTWLLNVPNLISYRIRAMGLFMDILIRSTLRTINTKILRWKSQIRKRKWTMMKTWWRSTRPPPCCQNLRCLNNWITYQSIRFRPYLPIQINLV